MSVGSSSGTWTQEKRAGKWRRASILAGSCAMASISTLSTWLSDGLSWCRLLVESAWSSVLSRFELLIVHWFSWLLWLYGGMTECYSCFGAWFASGYMLCDTWVLMSCSLFLRDGGFGS